MIQIISALRDQLAFISHRIRLFRIGFRIGFRIIGYDEKKKNICDVKKMIFL